MESDPITIEEAINRPGKEGKEWEVSRQTEWQNMIDHDVFGPPTIPHQERKFFEWELHYVQHVKMEK